MFSDCAGFYTPHLGREESISTTLHLLTFICVYSLSLVCRAVLKIHEWGLKKVLKQCGCIGIINMALYTASCSTISLSGTCLRGSAGCCVMMRGVMFFPAKGCNSLPWGHKEVQRQIKWQQSATAAQFLQHRSNCSPLLQLTLASLPWRNWAAANLLGCKKTDEPGDGGHNKSWETDQGKIH